MLFKQSVILQYIVGNRDCHSLLNVLKFWNMLFATDPKVAVFQVTRLFHSNTR